MFTGIIEEVGEIVDVRQDASNIHFSIKAGLAHELKVDQSVAHDGVCLTVTNLQEDSFTVCAIKETLERTSLADWDIGTFVNLERAMQLGSRLDGHMVQGHVDTTGECTDISDQGGSWLMAFSYDSDQNFITVPKGSICINGVSLTVVESKPDSFTVAIIPYTYENTGFRTIAKGTVVNLEFDVIGKYVARILAAQGQNTSLTI